MSEGMKSQTPWQEVGLTREEYDLISDHLGREPNALELGIYGLMWSEHCSYKSSREYLSRLPTEGPLVLEGPGENAGVIDLGEGHALAFRIESHNHPSAVEPVQGAATGIGGILRDIFTMGARPVALFDSLHFGDLERPRVRYLFEGVVSGISLYGNCVGVPTVGGEIYFDESYHSNPLVNVMCLGLTPKERLIRGRASGEDNPVFVVGARTGRDGIHGASLLASREFEEEAEDMRPAVQVGDPFREKLLIEACLELMESDAVVGINDLGAAGLASATSETAARAGTGIDIDVARVPRREEGMTPYEVMLSESQERMLVIARLGREDEVREIFDRWEIEAVRVGRVTGDGLLRVREDGREVACIPVESLTDGAPSYNRPVQEPSLPPVVAERDELSLPEDYTETLFSLLADPNLCSRRPVYRQYDHMVGINTVVNPGADAAVMRLKGSDRGFAATVDGNGMLCHLNPRRGIHNIVAESYQNLCAVGAEPVAITNCLNFGSPERPEVMWSFREVVRGMKEACENLKTPVTGGNVSFYNETSGREVYPTPVVGMVGTLDEVSRHAALGFTQDGQVVVLLGRPAGSLGGSHYLKIIHDTVAGPVPRVDFSGVRRVGEVVREAIRFGWVSAAHDISDGGLAVALAECAAAADGELGCEVTIEGSGERLDELLFGEGRARMLVAVNREYVEDLRQLAGEKQCPFAVIGQVGKNSVRISVRDPGSDEPELLINAPVRKLKKLREDGLR